MDALIRWLGGPVPARATLVLVPAAVLFTYGMVQMHHNLPVFSVWILEDGLLEWVTVAILVAMAAVAVERAATVGGGRPRLGWLAAAALFLFGAFEEISWGQRIVGWYSPEWFLQHNTQEETTIHNLRLGGIKLNKVVFGKMLGLVVGFYLLVLPILYARIASLRARVDCWTLPVPRTYQALLALVVFGLAETSRSITGKSGELQELGMVAVLMSVLLHPANLAATPAGVRLFGLAPALAAARDAATATLRHWLPARLRFLLLATLLLVTGFALLRLGFAAAFQPEGLVGPVGETLWDRGVTRFHATGPGLVPVSDVLWAWTVGLRFDLRMALLMLLPLALLGGVRALNPDRSRVARRAWLAYLGAAVAAVLLLYAVDFGQFAYENQRLNASLFDHLQETGIAAGMAWQTYPVGTITLALVLATACAVVLLGRWLPAQPAPYAGSRWRKATVVSLASVAYVLGLHGQWSQYPLRWSDAYFSPNSYIAALASNPLQTLFDTWRVPSAPLDVAAACRAQSRLAPDLGLAPCTAPPASFARFVPATPPATPPNVVIVILESFSAYKTGTFGNPLDPSPHFDALARSSLLFNRYYAAASPTARSIFSMMFGIPDITAGKSASRNPATVKQHTIANAFGDYRKHYFIGGSASWGNIRGMLLHNLPDLNLHEGESALPIDDVWGASDLALFKEAHRVLAAERGPFLAFIQTSGNHRPYTIPDDNDGFQRTALDAAALLAAGFAEPDAYDGLRFMDHSLGRFIELARTAPYYRNTIFAFFGDHGSRAQRFPPSEQILRQLHVPLVIHAPGRPELAGQVNHEPASSLDVLPTLAALAGVPHLNTTLGRNLLAPHGTPFAFLGPGGSRSLVDSRFLYSRLDAGGEALYRTRDDGSLEPGDLLDREPTEARRLRELADAMADSAAWLLQHNAPPEGNSSGPTGAAATGR